MKKYLLLLSCFHLLLGCSDPSHPTAIKMLKEIEVELSLNGQVKLSDFSEKFDEICAFQQDDSDDGFAFMNMNNLISKRKFSLQHTDNDPPQNPRYIILFIKDKKAFAAYDGEWALYYMILKGVEIEDGPICKRLAKSTVTP